MGAQAGRAQSVLDVRQESLTLPSAVSHVSRDSRQHAVVRSVGVERPSERHTHWQPVPTTP